MGNIVSDSTPIVYLAKVGKLHLLRKLYDDIVLPEAVKHEILAGDHPEVPVIQDAFQMGWLEERVLNKATRTFEQKHLIRALGLDAGEREAIALAYTSHLPLLIDEDEKTGRRVAKVWGVEVRGTLRVILEAYDNGLIEYREAREIFRQLLAERFHVSADVYERALSLLEKSKKTTGR
jgi:uncharacterized protein